MPSSRWGSLCLYLVNLVCIVFLLLWCWRESWFCVCAGWHFSILVFHMEPLISYLVLAFGVHAFRWHVVPDRASGYDLRRPYVAVPVYIFVVILFLVGGCTAGWSPPFSCFFPRLMSCLSR